MVMNVLMILIMIRNIMVMNVSSRHYLIFLCYTHKNHTLKINISSHPKKSLFSPLLFLLMLDRYKFIDVEISKRILCIFIVVTVFHLFFINVFYIHSILFKIKNNSFKQKIIVKNELN